MPRPYLPYALWNYTPMITSVETPGIMSATEAPLVCLQISQALVPYILGAVSLWTWRDKWRGDSAEVDIAVGVMNDLIAIIADGDNCPEGTMPTVFRLTEECDMQYSNDNGETWFSVPGWIDFAALCFTGPQGPAGPIGETGPQGPPGEDGICPDCGNPGTRPSPEDTITDDLESLCGGAMGSVQYLIDVLNYHLDQIEAHVGAIDALLNILTLNLKEAFEVLPVVGLLSQLITYVNTVGVAQLRANLNNPDFKEITACQLYCIVKRDGGLTQDGYYEWWDLLTLESIFGALTDAGEYLKGVLTAMSGTNNFDPAFDRGYAAFSRRFAIAATNPDGSCELLCTDCPAECPEEVFDWSEIGATPEGWASAGVMDFTGWTGDLTGLSDGDTNYACTRAENDDWLNNRNASSGNPGKIGIRYVLPEPCDVVRIRFTYSVGNGNGKRLAIGVKTAAGYEILQNTLDPAIAPMTISMDWMGAKSAVEEIYILAQHGGTSGTPQRITFCGINEPV